MNHFFSVANRSYVLILLLLIYISNNMDRFILGFLAEPIRRELQLSDTELGLLTGIVFALFYTFFSIPVAWLADRFGRIRIIVITCTIWCICSSFGGMASNFSQLALARIGVGIGDAGGAAPSYSLISALYSPRERARTFGLFHLAGPISMLIGPFACAWAATHYGWRIAVIAVSLPGLLVAIALFASVREPRLSQEEATLATSSFGATIHDFFKSPLCWMTALTAGLSSFTTYAFAAWLPSFFMRTKGMTLEEFGIWYSICYATSFGFGTWFGGYIADLWAKRNVRAYGLLPCCGLLTAAPFLVLTVMAPTWQLSLFISMIPVAAAVTFLAPNVTIIQNEAAASQRALFGALFLFANNLIGAGLGPLYVGVISDYLKPSQGNAALGFAIAGCLPVLVLASAAQFLVSQKLGRRSSNNAVRPLLLRKAVR